MQINLSGKWLIRLENETDFSQNNYINLPGILQAQGYGDEISVDTPWVSGLHDTLWYKREEYKHHQQSECNVPFLSQPLRHYIGKAFYQKEINVAQTDEYTLFMQLTRWRSTVWVDGVEKGGDCSLSAPHEINLGTLCKGTHILTICIDNSMQYPYRPDGHGVSDALGATWNGIAGEFVLRNTEQCQEIQVQKAIYATQNPRTIQVENGKFCVDGYYEYFRGTHFGGEYPKTGYPDTTENYWLKIFTAMKDFGLNFMRCHSCCLPEEAFMVADKLGIYIQVECSMWNVFNPDIEMLDVLNAETTKILQHFGHHPSFVMLSPTNEPDGQWYVPLKKWVEQAREINDALGYINRRIFTAQSGWYFDVEPKDVTGTDYIYFHRSGYGPILGGNIRNFEGWHGKDYRSSLVDCKLPVICHELGQWCAYPDFDIIEKFKGHYLQPSNYKVFKDNAKQAGVLPQNKAFAINSGKTQFMMYKEELEANFRTPSIYGFELLDLHDYLGQGTALVGVLDAFWDKKGDVDAEKWRQSCDEIVILARVSTYVYKKGDKVNIPVEICNFSKLNIENQILKWSLVGDNFAQNGVINIGACLMGDNKYIGDICIDFTALETTQALVLKAEIANSVNQWDITAFAPITAENACYTKDWQKAKQMLSQGKNVVFSPYMSTLDYNCPGLNIKPVFWNAQMGPIWVRPMGLIADVAHDIFKDFPTFEHGGWQWEDILSHARGFCTDAFPPNFNLIVQPIDDWNRNIPQALIFEAKILGGSLLFVSADLDGDFENRPAAHSLKSAILKYAQSLSFAPTQQLSPHVIEKHFHQCNILKQLNARVSAIADTVIGAESLVEESPNSAIHLLSEEYPFIIKINWDKEINLTGITIMQNQKDRMHDGDVESYELLANGDIVAKGQLLSTIKAQNIMLDKPVFTNNITFVAKSRFCSEQKTEWVGDYYGWSCKTISPKPQCSISVLQPITDYVVQPNDLIFWDKNVKSSTKEIDN